MSQGAWLVTGASGFLGRHLLDEIHAGTADPRAVALVRNPGEWDAMGWTRALTGVETISGTVADAEQWGDDPRLDGVAGIFHLAALVRHRRRGAGELYRTNVEGTAAMVRLAARRRCRMVFVSTSGTVGCFRSASGSADEASPFCEAEVSGWPYYTSKIAAEREARRLAGQLGVDLVIVRPPVLLGPGDHKFRSTGHLTRFLRGRLPFLVSGGMHFADVRDAARALLRAMVRPGARPVYHLPGTVCSIEEFFALAGSIAGKKPPSRMLPYRTAWWLARLTEPLGVLPDPVVIEMAAHHWGMRSLFAGTELDYQSRPGAETLRDTVEWLRANHPGLAA